METLMMTLMAISVTFLCAAVFLFTIIMCIVTWHDSFKK